MILSIAFLIKRKPKQQGATFFLRIWTRTYLEDHRGRCRKIVRGQSYRPSYFPVQVYSLTQVKFEKTALLFIFSLLWVLVFVAGISLVSAPSLWPEFVSSTADRFTSFATISR